ncbi:MAG: hypothetical protein M1839_007535 [Geoglossum umbratile]|nr:MAG: hypothetical protein M1839_007535 [Geoglossum umbratile]
MVVPSARATSRGAHSNDRSRALSRRRRLSDTCPWTPEPWAPEPWTAEPTASGFHGAGEPEAPGARKTRILLWLSVFVLQLSTASSCVAAVFLVQDLRGTGPGPLHIIWLVLSVSLCLTAVVSIYLALRRRRELHRLATQSAITQLNADVETLVQRNVELQTMNRRSGDHGGTSSRRASPLGEEDFASYHRFQERGMDIGVKQWLDQMAPFKGMFEDLRDDSWFGSTGKSEITSLGSNPRGRTVRTA